MSILNINLNTQYHTLLLLSTAIGKNADGSKAKIEGRCICDGLRKS